MVRPSVQASVPPTRTVTPNFRPNGRGHDRHGLLQSDGVNAHNGLQVQWRHRPLRGRVPPGGQRITNRGSEPEVLCRGRFSRRRRRLCGQWQRARVSRCIRKLGAGRFEQRVEVRQVDSPALWLSAIVGGETAVFDAGSLSCEGINASSASSPAPWRAMVSASLTRRISAQPSRNGCPSIGPVAGKRASHWRMAVTTGSMR